MSREPALRATGERPAPATQGFACDAMLCGLARWLRAWGYDATWSYGIADDVLLAQARVENRIVLTADGGILRRRVVRLGDPPAWAVSHNLSPLAQLEALIAEHRLPRRPARCMKCGGLLDRVTKEAVAPEIPARTRAWLDEYYRCRRCLKLYWRGTHYHSVQQRLAALAVR